MFWNKKNKNKSHIKREWSAEIGKLNYIIENMEKGIDKEWVLDELDDLYEIAIGGCKDYNFFYIYKMKKYFLHYHSYFLLILFKLKLNYMIQVKRLFLLEKHLRQSEQMLSTRKSPF